MLAISHPTIVYFPITLFPIIFSLFFAYSTQLIGHHCLPLSYRVSHTSSIIYIFTDHDVSEQIINPNNATTRKLYIEKTVMFLFSYVAGPMEYHVFLTSHIHNKYWNNGIMLNILYMEKCTTVPFTSVLLRPSCPTLLAPQQNT